MHDPQSSMGAVLFGEWLRELRIRKGIGQAELARRCALPASYLSAIERNRRPPPIAQTIERIAVALALEDAEREAVVTHTRQSRQRWSADKSSLKEVGEQHLEKLDGVGAIATLRCMLREAKQVAVEASATVEVTSRHFRVVVRPDAQHGTAVHVDRLAAQGA